MTAVALPPQQAASPAPRRAVARQSPALAAADLTPLDGAPAMLAIVARAASDPAVDVAKMQALLDMQERILGREALGEFNQAFARLSAKLPRIKKRGQLEYPINKNDPDGPKRLIAHFAKWEDIMEAVQPLLIEEGFALTFKAAPRTGDGGGLLVSGKLLHIGGHSEEASIPLPLDSSGGKNNLQGYGSTFQYGKRYTATMLLNIVTEGEDDDGRRGGVEFINDETAAQITDALAKRKIPLAPFLDLLGVRSVGEIEVGDLPKARNALKAWKPDVAQEPA